VVVFSKIGHKRRIHWRNEGYAIIEDTLGKNREKTTEMNKTQQNNSTRNEISELEVLLGSSEPEITSVQDVLDLYDDYEELSQLVQEYEDITNPEPYSTASNNSNPTVQSG
jgi:hypothetical protein